MPVDIAANRQKIEGLQRLLDAKKSTNDVGGVTGNTQGAVPPKPKAKDSDGKEQDQKEPNIFEAIESAIVAVLKLVATVFNAISDLIKGATGQGNKDHSADVKQTLSGFENSSEADIRAEINRLEDEIKDQEKKDAKGPEPKGNSLFDRLMSALGFGGKKEEVSKDGADTTSTGNLESELDGESRDDESCKELATKEARELAKKEMKGVMKGEEHDGSPAIAMVNKSHADKARDSKSSAGMESSI